MFDTAPTATAGATPTVPVSLAIVNPQLPEGLKAPVPPAASIVAPSPEPKAQPRVQTPRNAEPALRPAVVVTQVSPHFPPELKSVVISPKTVNVRVSIDESGRVLRATPLPKQNVHLFLINAAVRAAELSKFQPARKGDQAVASELVLQFTIRPGQ
jgi:hypothetical protein